MGAKEKQIEDELVAQLVEQKYVYRDDIHERKTLEANFRKKFQELNSVILTDGEFDRLLNDIVSSDVFKSSKLLREPQQFTRDDNTTIIYTLVNIKDWCKNDYEVVRQLNMNTTYSHHRYDVILLINGLPLVQIELKDTFISPNKAIEQIVKYKQDPGNGYTNTIMCFMQLFIVSNKTKTMYFANNNDKYFRFDANEQYLPVYHASLRDTNHPVYELHAFTQLMLQKCDLGRLLSRYMVLVESTRQIMVMRPYQIYAVESILQAVDDNSGNGYIWHTTGSGKTLTSFKTSTLLKSYPNIDKCVFVVDRKDLDKQTRDEFNRFQPGCVEQNVDTEALVRRLLSDNYADKVIVTTIQKLGIALDPSHKENYVERLHQLKDKRVVFIFDECHRSQFGENNRAIREFFPKAQMFGFTGTPIFEENSSYIKVDGTKASYKTTKDVFGQLLHQYTITNAIDDKNVLGFHIDYYRPEKDGKPIHSITKRAIVEEILDKHDQTTSKRRFNALFATSSIDDAIEYNRQFGECQQERIENDPDYQPLNIACVFTPPAEGNKDIQQLQEDLPQEQQDNKEEPNRKKDALQSIIQQYNAQFGTNFSIGFFDDYYKDVQQRIKNQSFPNSDIPHDKKVDIVIVVDMLLTGFDSKYLNTLYVDKDLKYHSLIQAFSRTNRILNKTKPSGNILCFRNLEDAVDRAMVLFSGEDVDKNKARQIWLVPSAPVIIDKFSEAIEKLKTDMLGCDVDFKPEEVHALKGDAAKKQFLENFKEVQSLKNQLDQYTDISPEQRKALEELMPEDTLRAFQGSYLEIYRSFKTPEDPNPGGGKDTLDDFDFDLVLFSTANIDYDYIMDLLAKYVGKPDKVKLTKEQLIAILASSSNLVNEKIYLEAYINSLKMGSGMDEVELKANYEKFKAEMMKKEIDDIAKEYNISFELLNTFIVNSTTLYRLDDVTLDAMFADKGWKERSRGRVKLLKKLQPLLMRYTDERSIDGLDAYING